MVYACGDFGQGWARRVVLFLIKLPQSETAPQHTIVIEELSAWP